MASGRAADPDGGVEVDGLLEPNEDFRYPIPVPGGILSRIPLATGPDGKAGIVLASRVDGEPESAPSAFTLFDSPLGPDREPRLRAAKAAANASLPASNPTVGGDLPACDEAVDGGEPVFGVACGIAKNGSDMIPTPGVPGCIPDGCRAFPPSVSCANGPPRCGE